MNDEDLNPEHLRGPTFAEQLAIDSYKTAVQGAIADASSFGDKVVTTVVAVASAYGAVIALVAPEDTPSTFEVVIPFVAFALAVGFALFAQGVATDVDDTNDLKAIQSRVSATIRDKRRLANAGLFALVVGLFLAGYVVHDTYGKPAQDTSKPATVWLSPAGKELVSTACGSSSDTLAGEVVSAEALGSKRISIEVDKTACPNGAGTLVLPPAAVSAALLSD